MDKLGVSTPQNTTQPGKEITTDTQENLKGHPNHYAK